MKIDLNTLTNVVFGLNSIGIKSEDIILTGSLALSLQGVLPESREIHDIDIIIRTTDRVWNCLTDLCSGNKKDEYKCEDKCLTINEKSTTLNIWRAKNHFDHVNLKEPKTCVWISPVKNILKVKKTYGRCKDLNDINNIAKYILE